MYTNKQILENKLQCFNFSFSLVCVCGEGGGGGGGSAAGYYLSEGFKAAGSIFGVKNG